MSAHHSGKFTPDPAFAKHILTLILPRVCDQGSVEHFDGDVNDYKRRITAQANEAGVATTHH